MAAETLYLCADKWSFVQVLALFLVLIHPQIGEHPGYLQRHQSAEDGVAGILRGGREDAHIEAFLYVEHIANLLREYFPLVVAEVVDNDEEDFLAVIEHREDLALEYIR